MISPDFESVPPYYRGYVNQVRNLDLFDAFRQSAALSIDLVSSIPEEIGEYRYEPEKWSIKELLCHVMDAERIFAYRALRFARNDKTPLSAFEENEYVPEANAHARTLQQLANEIGRLRETTIDLYKSFTPAMLLRKGSANNTEVSVLNLGFIISGHEAHHRNILVDRYLKA